MIPKVNGREATGTGKFVLQSPITVSNAFSANAVRAFEERMGTKGYALQQAETAVLTIAKDPGLEREAYTLAVGKEGIRIEAGDENGAIWALTTLLKRVGTDGSIEACSISDAPRAAHRGVMLDVARHFFTAEEVKRVIEQISLAKMNVLHWHLADDQGWRIESRKYPKLHQCSGNYYTQDEIRDVVDFALSRGVEVVPEIDMPGHTRGILAAYPEYSCSGREVELAKAGGIYKVILCAGAEKTYSFLEELLDEVCPLFPSKRFHLGGDEAPKVEWETCPACKQKMESQGLTRYGDLQGYFSVRVSEILKKQGKQAVFWNDVLESDIRPEGMQLQYWLPGDDRLLAEYIAQGGQWIYSDMYELYLDYPHAMTSVRKMYGNRIDQGDCAWDGPGAPYGYEACLWTEQVETNEQLEQHLFPRIYVMAELAWHGAGDDYEEFEARLRAEMEEVRRKGISVVPYEDWNPQGQKRQQEASEYMSRMLSGLPKDDKGETMNPVGIAEDFKKTFMARFFRDEDISGLMG